MTNIVTKYHRLFKFEYNPTFDSAPMPAWVVRLVADSSILFNTTTQKWYLNKQFEINDGDYLVQIHPDYSELRQRVQNGNFDEGAEIFDRMNQALGIDVNFLDMHSYGVLAADRYDDCIVTLQKTEPTAAEELTRLRKEQG